MRYLNLFLKYQKVNIEKQIAEERIIELEEKMKQLLFDEVMINPRKLQNAYENEKRLRARIKVLKEKLEMEQLKVKKRKKKR